MCSMCFSSIQLHNFLPPDPRCTATVYFRLRWPNNGRRGRICIELFPNTSFGLIVLRLCTGEYGRSYRNTRLASVVNRGERGDAVSVGYDGGIVGELEVRPFGIENTYPPQWEGDVYALEFNDVWNPQFSIIINGLQGPAERGAVFGRVVEGLDVLRDAENYHPITEIKVVDCGVALQGWESW